MAGKKCCIEGCTSSSSRNEDIGVTFHKFPKDPDLYNTWIKVTHINPNIENVLYVCSRHFCKSDFQIYQDSKYILKSGAIPSIFFWTMEDSKFNLEAQIEAIFKDDHEDSVIVDTSKESEPENIESIKKLIEEEQLLIKNVDKLESSEDLGLSITALDVIHKFQDIPITANSVMNLIVNVEPKGYEKDQSKYRISTTETGTVALSIGCKVDAKDFSCQWHSATIIEVDYDELEVLVHYDDSSNMPDEWISVNSTRLRPHNPNRALEVSTPTMPPKANVQNSDTQFRDDNKMDDKKKIPFFEGERCLARWRDNKRCMATIKKDLGDGQYEIIFDDGFQWQCSISRLHKLKDANSKPIENLSVDTSVSGNSCALSPVTAGSGPLGTPAFHTHLFDPTRDYLGSKSERREMKRKLNIKEIFNIGQKKKKVKLDDAEQKGIKKKVKVEPKEELPDAVAAIIGTVEEKIGAEMKQENEVSEDDRNIVQEEITMDDLIESKDIDASYISDSDPNNCSYPVSNEEDTLERFDKPDDSVNVAVIDRMKEVISKLESGLNEADESAQADSLAGHEPELNLEVIQVDPNGEEIDFEAEEHLKMGAEMEDAKPEPTVGEQASFCVKIEEKQKKVASKVKKNKKLRLLHEKKVKKQVEKVKNELEEMKRQVEEMRKQMLEKTHELAAQHRQRPPHEMPESFLLPGEWCCRWANGEPVGQVHETENEPRGDAHHRPALPRRSVLVEDKRLPSGWKKIMVRRSLGQSAGKWDVVLVSPDQKRFHTKQEMRMYLEQSDGALKAYEYALLDFSVHLKLSRRMGWVSQTGPAKAPPPISNVSPFINTKKLTLKKEGKKRLKIRKPNYILQRQEGEAADPTAESDKSADADAQNPPIENGFIFVGSLKVQVIDNLLRCPAEGCLKNFRNNTLLKMHMKHYHRELKKLLGRTPKVLELAYARARPAGEKVSRKGKAAKPPKKNHAETAPDASKPLPELRLNLSRVDVAPDDVHKQDSPNSREAMVPKPVKRPKVLLPVRRPEPEPTSASEEVGPESSVKPGSAGDKEVADFVDFEASISTHTVTRPSSFKSEEVELKPKLAFSEDEDWLHNSDFETRSSFPGSATPDSKTMDKGTPNPAVSSESTEEAKQADMYMYTESGERIKIERMRREEIINCHCGFREEDGLMVQCELCLCWQHALCHNIRTEAEVPEKYTCSICLNPRRGRRSKRFLHDQDRLFEGLLPGAKPCDFLRRSHELSGNLIRIQDALHAMRVKYYVATKKNHPKLYLWAKDWENTELNFTQERLNSEYSDLNIIINNIGKENLPVKSGADDEREALLNLSGAISGMPLEFPISTTELERMARSIQEQECRVAAPQPEAAIENSVCRERLLRHVQRSQAQIDSRLDSIEAQVAELESQDPSFEDDETADYFPRTKQTIQMLMRDLETMEELGVIT